MSRTLPAVSGLAYLLVGAASAGELVLIGSPAGMGSRVLSLSYNGATCIGYSVDRTSTFRAFSWDAGTRTDYQDGLIFNAVSNDGRSVTGSGIAPGVVAGRPFRLTFPSSYLDLGRPRQTTGIAVGSGVSTDGSAVVGYFFGNQTQSAFRWTADGGIQNIGHVFGSTGYTEAKGVSGDGRKVVGESRRGNLEGQSYAFLWTPESGMQALPPPAGVEFQYDARAMAISGDGRVIVGQLIGSDSYSAAYWVDGECRRFDMPQGYYANFATHVNYDGSVILGIMQRATNDSLQFIQTPQFGIMPALDYLRMQGVPISLTAVVDIYAVSGDGRSFGGSYWDPANGIASQGFIATVPAPGTIAVAAGGLWALGRRRRNCSPLNTR